MPLCKPGIRRSIVGGHAPYHTCPSSFGCAMSISIVSASYTDTPAAMMMLVCFVPARWEGLQLLDLPSIVRVDESTEKWSRFTSACTWNRSIIIPTERGQSSIPALEPQAPYPMEKQAQIHPRVFVCSCFSIARLDCLSSRRPCDGLLATAAAALAKKEPFGPWQQTIAPRSHREIAASNYSVVALMIVKPDMLRD